MARIRSALFVSLLVGTGASVMSQSRQIIRTGPDLGLPFSPAVRAGGFIYVSGTLATDPKGQLIAGDIKAQTRQVLDNIAATLKAAGSDLAHAVSVQVYLKRAEDFAAMNDVYRTYWPSDPPARTTVVSDLLLNGLIEVSMVAVPAGAERRVVHPRSWITSPNPYSYGILSGDTLFLSGLISRNGRDNSVVEGDIGVQTRTVLDNAGAILEEAGMSHANVVSSRVFITDTALFQPMNAVYREYFPQAPPARATVKAGLMGPQYLVEISMIASRATKQAIIPPNPDGTPGRASPVLSPAIRAGNRLYVSGMLGNTADNKGDVAAQTRETLARIGRTLTAAGFAWGDVVDGVVYLTDLSRFQEMNTGYREIFAKDFPARATVGVGLVAPDGLVEIMLTAVK